MSTINIVLEMASSEKAASKEFKILKLLSKFVDMSRKIPTKSKLFETLSPNCTISLNLSGEFSLITGIKLPKRFRFSLKIKFI